MPNYTVSSDVDTLLRSTNNFDIRSNIGAAQASTVATLVTDVQDHTNDILSNYNMITTLDSDLSLLASDVSSNTSNISSNSENITTLQNEKAPLDSPVFEGNIQAQRIITHEIQCEGTAGTGVQPITYDAAEHRFRDHDNDPTNLLLIKKVDDEDGARIGINQPSLVPTPRCALEIHYGSTDGVNRETLRVMGGAFFNEYVRVGHYATAPVDSEGVPTLPVGSIILNTTTHKFQGNVGSAYGGWKTFQFEAE